DVPRRAWTEASYSSLVRRRIREGSKSTVSTPSGRSVTPPPPPSSPSPPASPSPAESPSPPASPSPVTPSPSPSLPPKEGALHASAPIPRRRQAAATLLCFFIKYIRGFSVDDQESGLGFSLSETGATSFIKSHRCIQ